MTHFFLVILSLDNRQQIDTDTSQQVIDLLSTGGYSVVAVSTSPMVQATMQTPIRQHTDSGCHHWTNR
jgi:cobalamin biosynthesis Co2+ chelatase CbiK